MALLIVSNISLTCRLIVLYMFIALLLKAGFAVEDKSIKQSHHHTFDVISLLPSSSCQNSPFKESNKKTTLEVFHKHGPCSTLSQQTKPDSSTPTHEQILQEDQARVKSINTMLSKSKTIFGSMKLANSTSLPAKHGSVIGSGNYVVKVGLGTPKKELTLTFDTGSDITWTQCEPCGTHCYQQRETIFDPASSTSYSNVSCNSSACSSLSSLRGVEPACASSTCMYDTLYGDNSYSNGFFAKETLTLSAGDTFTNFLFGCGQNNSALFKGTAGILGLGREAISLVSQTEEKYNKLFSYCLPSTSSGTGFLMFGNTQSKSPKFTKLSTLVARPSHYGIKIAGITFEDEKLNISSSLFSNPGAIIDSGTVISRLPQAAYAVLRAEFRKAMSKYPTAPVLSLMDTCYDLSRYKDVKFPKIGLVFSDGLEVDIDPTGIVYAKSEEQVCLAFAPNKDKTEMTILGNVQQKTYEIVYDSANRRLGFAPGGCS